MSMSREGSKRRRIATSDELELGYDVEAKIIVISDDDDDGESVVIDISDDDDEGEDEDEGIMMQLWKKAVASEDGAFRMDMARLAFLGPRGCQMDKWSGERWIRPSIQDKIQSVTDHKAHYAATSTLNLYRGVVDSSVEDARDFVERYTAKVLKVLYTLHTKKRKCELHKGELHDFFATRLANGVAGYTERVFESAEWVKKFHEFQYGESSFVTMCGEDLPRDLVCQIMCYLGHDRALLMNLGLACFSLYVAVLTTWDCLTITKSTKIHDIPMSVLKSATNAVFLTRPVSEETVDYLASNMSPKVIDFRQYVSKKPATQFTLFRRFARNALRTDFFKQCEELCLPPMEFVRGTGGVDFAEADCAKWVTLITSVPMPRLHTMTRVPTCVASTLMDAFPRANNLGLTKTNKFLFLSKTEFVPVARPIPCVVFDTVMRSGSTFEAPVLPVDSVLSTSAVETIIIRRKYACLEHLMAALFPFPEAHTLILDAPWLNTRYYLRPSPKEISVRKFVLMQGSLQFLDQCLTHNLFPRLKEFVGRSTVCVSDLSEFSTLSALITSGTHVSYRKCPNSGPAVLRVEYAVGGGDVLVTIPSGEDGEPMQPLIRSLGGMRPFLTFMRLPTRPRLPTGTRLEIRNKGMTAMDCEDVKLCPRTTSYEVYSRHGTNVVSIEI